MLMFEEVDSIDGMKSIQQRKKPTEKYVIDWNIILIYNYAKINKTYLPKMIFVIPAIKNQCKMTNKSTFIFPECLKRSNCRMSFQLDNPKGLQY